MRKVMISRDDSTIAIIDDCEGKADKIRYFGLLQCPKKDFDEKVKEYEQLGFVELTS